jgi:hypothetical protein
LIILTQINRLLLRREIHFKISNNNFIAHIIIIAKIKTPAKCGDF